MNYYHPHHVIVDNRIRHLGGWKRDIPDHRDFQAADYMKPSSTIPASFNTKEYNIPVFDQEDLGSCTANGTLYCYAQLGCSLGKSIITLSRLFNYYMTRTRYEHVAPNDDSGAQVRNAVKCLAQYGSCLERYWPYDPKPDVRFGLSPPVQATKDAKQHMLLVYSRLTSLAQIKQALVSGHAVVGGFTCFDSIDDPQVSGTGIIPAPTPYNYIVGGHCVAFVGYDDQKQLLRFRNSWGRNWGAAGDGFLPYSYVDHGLATDFWMMSAEMG